MSHWLPAPSSGWSRCLPKLPSNWWLMDHQFGKNSVRQPPGNPLGDFRVGAVPLLRFWLYRQNRAGIVRLAQLLKPANVDLTYQFKTTFWWLLDILAEQIPVLSQRNNLKTAHRRA